MCCALPTYAALGSRSTDCSDRSTRDGVIVCDGVLEHREPRKKYGFEALLSRLLRWWCCDKGYQASH